MCANFHFFVPFLAKEDWPNVAITCRTLKRLTTTLPRECSAFEKEQRDRASLWLRAKLDFFVDDDVKDDKVTVWAKAHSMPFYRLMSFRAAYFSLLNFKIRNFRSLVLKKALGVDCKGPILNFPLIMFMSKYNGPVFWSKFENFYRHRSYLKYKWWGELSSLSKKILVKFFQIRGLPNTGLLRWEESDYRKGAERLARLCASYPTMLTRLQDNWGSIAHYLYMHGNGPADYHEPLPCSEALCATPEQCATRRADSTGFFDEIAYSESITSRVQLETELFTF